MIHSAQTHSFCLPEGINDRTPPLTNHVVVPQPRLRVDRLPHCSQNLQRCSAVPVWWKRQIMCLPKHTMERKFQVLTQLFVMEGRQVSAVFLRSFITTSINSGFNLVLKACQTSQPAFFRLLQSPAPSSVHSSNAYFFTGASPAFMSARIAVGAV